MTPCGSAGVIFQRRRFLYLELQVALVIDLLSDSHL